MYSCYQKLKEFRNVIFGDKELCTVWPELSQINFNFYYNQRKKTISFEQFIKAVVNLNGDKIIINAGHYIPNVLRPNKIGINPKNTWKMACVLASSLKVKGCVAKISLLVNDLSLSPKERLKMSYTIPGHYLELIKSYKLSEDDVIFDSANAGQVYTEKRLSNKTSYQLRRTHNLKDYDEKKIINHCQAAIIGYLRDIKKQGATVSIWIAPKCTSSNLLYSLKLFDKAEGGLEHLAFFETNNCYL